MYFGGNPRQKDHNRLLQVKLIIIFHNAQRPCAFYTFVGSEIGVGCCGIIDVGAAQDMHVKIKLWQALCNTRVVWAAQCTLFASVKYHL